LVESHILPPEGEGFKFVRGYIRGVRGDFSHPEDVLEKSLLQMLL
jgi:hypothetical protein